MSQAPLRTWRFFPLLALLAIGPEATIGQDKPRSAPLRSTALTSLMDPRLEAIRLASVSWDSRLGPEREVVDQVCLVPDVATFLDAIATWDRGHAFPILFDDVESSFRFIRAFKPSRVVRFPKSAASIPPDRLWERAVAAVGSTWSEPGASPELPGDAVPKSLGPTPPGVVVSAPDAPMLAGAVALAAGRFQPLVRLDSGRKYADVLNLIEFTTFDGDLTAAIRRKVPNCESLGDGCDFLTLAGDWPYRVRDAKGEVNAVDDRLGRSAGTDQRWAFAGRLMGDGAASVYRAMCSLFLQPEAALMFNGYDENASPWSDYSMKAAAVGLSKVLPTTHVSGESQAGIDGWHETFDPLNRYGLVILNSHGSPTVFNIRGGPASAADIPRGVPSVVLMIHSFSAADPADPSTVAGRWLANGAFAFYGSVNEPFLAAFRNPRLVGDLLAERLPVVAAVRATLAEPFGTPWRLIFLGDPLYRVNPRGAVQPRIASWDPTARWPAYARAPRPEQADEAALFQWALKTSIARLCPGDAAVPEDEAVEALLGIRRDRLPEGYRPIFDALLVEVLLQARKRSALRSKIAAIPDAERSPALRRCFETLLEIDLSLTLARGDASKARAAWSELIRLDAPRSFKEMATARVGRLADTPVRRRDWAEILRLALRDRSRSPEAEIISAELKRVDEAIQADRARPQGR